MKELQRTAGVSTLRIAGAKHVVRIVLRLGSEVVDLAVAEVERTLFLGGFAPFVAVGVEQERVVPAADVGVGGGLRVVGVFTICVQAMRSKAVGEPVLEPG